MRLLAALGLALPLGAMAQQQEINRALIERDQQSAEFAARLRGQDARALENLHARQKSEALQPLSPDPGIAQQLLPYQRGAMEQERRHFDSPVFERPEGPPAAPRQPLPLPGGPQPGVDAVGADGVAH
ncbi:MAG: hypothetical protein ACM30H_10925 [Clostridia bacterium]